MTGVYLRVERNGKWENVEVEHLTRDERKKILSDDPRILQWLDIVCQKLCEAEKVLNEMVDDGILERT